VEAAWDLLHLITKLELGGAQLATLREVAGSCFATGARHLAFGPGGQLDEAARALPGVTVHTLPSLGRAVSPLDDVRAVLEVATLVRRLRRPGARLLVHTHSSKAGVVGRLAARLGGADLVVHSVHGFGHTHHARGLGRRLLASAEWLAGWACDGLTADSLANVRQGERESLFHGRPARVVRCGVDLDAFATPKRERARVRAELGVGAEAPVVLTLACLKPQKDPLTWAEVGRRVTAARPGTVFLLAGDGELRPAVEAFIASRGLQGSLRLLGWRQDVAELLHASDVFFLPSRWEGLPQAIVQAMAARLPVVATDVDGNPEAVRPDETGVLCRPGDADAMSVALLALLADPARRAALGARGATCAEPFSERQMLADLDAFYAELAASRA
jgi:glycosyltransferase involved in cell wall biosynthesis